jgi:hypothetical protein
MEINYVEQTTSKLLSDENFDIIICASGYESRATFFLSKLTPAQLTNAKRICFAFPDRHVHSRDQNDKLLKKNDFTFFQVNSPRIDAYTEIYHTLFKTIVKKKVNVFLDYSCMTSVLYASMVKYFKDFSSQFDEVSIFFSYTQALFCEPHKGASLFYNEPIPLFDPIQSTDKKIALIIGLGYEEDKALGLYEYFQNDNQDIYLFVTGKSSGEFYNEAFKNNKKLINIVDTENLLVYDLSNIPHLLSTIDALVNYLINTDYRVVLAPIGPKVFTLCAMLVNLLHREVTIYRLSDGDLGEPVDRIADPDKELIITHLSLISQKILAE